MSVSPAILAQYLLPKTALTRAAGRLARARGGAATAWAIRRFIARYGVDMAEAADPDPAHYASFNDFFTRPLRPDARPLAQADYLCPVDGAISQFGDIAGDQIFQAKGHAYSTTALLAGDAQLAAPFAGGQFATLYLSPRDYHRIHMPCAGRLTQMIHVPGALFSVNPATASAVPGLFARNERVVCLFDTARGPLALVLVGATIVGSMATAWHGVVNPPRPGHIRRWAYDDKATLNKSPRAGAPAVGMGCEAQSAAIPVGIASICNEADRPNVGCASREGLVQRCLKTIELAQGAELGRFLLGSTVIALWPAGSVRFNPDWSPGAAVRMGQILGTAYRE